MSFNTQTSRLSTGFLTATAGSSFQGNVNINSTCYVNNQIRDSTENVKELVLTPSDQLVLRPYVEKDCYNVVDRFAMCHCVWETVQEAVPSLIEVIFESGSVVGAVLDTIEYFTDKTITANTTGKIISDYVWSIRSNDTVSIFANNLAPVTMPINGIVTGLLISIADNIPVRHYCITRPLRAIKTSSLTTSSGLSFELKFCLLDLSTSQKYSFGLGQSNAVSRFNGDNFDTASYSFGFMINHSLFGNYSIRAFVRTAGVTTYYDTGVVAVKNALITMKINWDYEFPDCRFFVSCLGSNNVTTTTPSTNILYDPFINSYNPANTFSRLLLNDWRIKFYNYSV